MANNHRTSEQWQQIFKQHAESNLHIATFCKQQKINTSSFYAWRKRLTSNTVNSVITKVLPPVEKAQDNWVNVVPENVVPSPNWDIEVALPNGIILRMMNS